MAIHINIINVTKPVAPPPESSLATTFGIRRASSLTIDVSDPEIGNVGINSIVCDHYPWVGTYLSVAPVQVRAIPKPGYKFAGWSDGVETIARSINVGEINSLTAHFEAA